jgi:hypothetical protein
MILVSFSFDLGNNIYFLDQSPSRRLQQTIGFIFERAFQCPPKNRSGFTNVKIDKL